MINPLNHPVIFTQPLRLAVQPWQEHIPFGMFLVDLLRPAMIVELGTHAGDSYCAFCQAVSVLELKTSCYAVDTWQGDEHAGFYDQSVLEGLRAHHDPLYSGFSTLVQSTFADAVQYFVDGSIDLLHIDGLHTYDAVKEDFETWLPKLSDRGVVLFHDINVREQNFGVVHFWDELTKQYPHFEFPHGHGLGLLAVGQSRNEGLRELLACNEQETALLRKFFFHLGYGVRMRYLATDRKVAMENREQELAAHIAGQMERIHQLEQLLKQKEEAAQQLSRELMAEHQKLNTIVQSAGWRMLQRLWWLKAKISSDKSSGQ